MITPILLLAVTVLVSYANGANDNFKGVATLYGSGTASFRTALIWGNVTTLAGALSAVILGHGLAVTFGGKGLVPDEIARSAVFVGAVGLAAAATVLIATWFGLPISTTHSLIGALAGAGLVAAPSALEWSTLGFKFFLPLAVTPLLAFSVTLVLYPILSSARGRLGIGKSSCGCAGWAPASIATADGVALNSGPLPVITLGTTAECQERYEGRIVGVSAQGVLNTLHFASAGAVCFARGLNDAPKIAALALAGAVLPFPQILMLTGAGMLIGGWLSAKRVAETMGQRITAMNDGQGFTANLTTASLVLVGSAASLPLSTTHVSCGALFGLGAVTKGARGKMIMGIVASWFATLPIAAVLAAATFMLLS